MNDESWNSDLGLLRRVFINSNSIRLRNIASRAKSPTMSDYMTVTSNLGASATKECQSDSSTMSTDEKMKVGGLNYADSYVGLFRDVAVSTATAAAMHQLHQDEPLSRP